jgi:hypothetical protein
MKHDLFKELIAEYSSNSLSEKWYQWDSVIEGAWHSDSASQFRAFLQNAAAIGIKGLRACIRPDCYLAVKGLEAAHRQLIEFAKQNYLVDSSVKWTEFEMLKFGFPKADNFSQENMDTLDPFYEPVKYKAIIADCGSFEAILDLFESEQFPDFKNDTAKLWLGKAISLETSETYKVLKPLIKGIRLDEILY